MTQPAVNAIPGEPVGQALEGYRRYLLQIAQQEMGALQAKGGASDLVQETFLEAQRDFAQFRGTTEAEFRAWLRGLLLHRAANFRRQYRGTQKRAAHREVALQAGPSSGGPGAGLCASDPSPSGQVMALEEAQALRRALELLPPDYQQVLALRYFEDRSFEEIGRLMQRTANAARLLWLRAIERLQDQMGP